MTVGIADTNILVETYRGNQVAKAWLEAQTDLAITSVTWLEFMEGARGKAGQARCLEIIAPFDILFLTDADQRWAMSQIFKYHLSHGVSFEDCLIGSVCHRLQMPLYTKNVKDFLPMLGPKLVVKPY